MYGRHARTMGRTRNESTSITIHPLPSTPSAVTTRRTEEWKRDMSLSSSRLFSSSSRVNLGSASLRATSSAGQQGLGEALKPQGSMEEAGGKASKVVSTTYGWKETDKTTTQTDTWTDTRTQTQTHRHRQTQTDTDRHRHRHTDTDTDTHTWSCVC